MSDIYRDARHGDRKLARARMGRVGFADGGMVDVPTPKPRPPFGADDSEFSTSVNGPIQTGHMNDKTGEMVFDDKVAPWRQKIEDDAAAQRAAKRTKGTKP